MNFVRGKKLSDKTGDGVTIILIMTLWLSIERTDENSNYLALLGSEAASSMCRSRKRASKNKQGAKGLINCSCSSSKVKLKLMTVLVVAPPPIALPLLIKNYLLPTLCHMYLPRAYIMPIFLFPDILALLLLNAFLLLPCVFISALLYSSLPLLLFHVIVA